MHEKADTRMIYIGYVILFFVCLFTCISIVNTFTKVYLPKKVKLDNQPFVSILIPARNEEQNIGYLLDDISQQSYSNYEVIVYDDQSTDKTQEIIKNKISKNNKIRLLEGKILENGWLGKNFACHQLSLHAKGDFLLFLDADVRIKNSLIEKSLSMVQKYKLGLLSIFPKQILENKGSWYTVPLMNWILLSLLPLVLVRISSWVSFSAANGQFMLFDANTYKLLTPHQRFKNFKVEDIAICRYYKKQKIKVATLLGNEDIRCRMYDSLDDAVNGFAKNVFAFFGNSIFVALLFAVFTTFAPFILLYIFGVSVFVFYVFATLLKRATIAKASCQSVGLNLLYLPIQHFMFLNILFTALVNRKSLTWKGRSIS